MPYRCTYRGFTWIELIVVLVIIAVLLGLLVPAILNSREQTRQAQCKNNMKQIGLGLQNYFDSRKCFPGSAEFVKVQGKAGGWSFLFKIMPGGYGSENPAVDINPLVIKNTISLNDNDLVDPLTHSDRGLKKTRTCSISEFLCPSNPNKTFEDPANKKVAFTNYKGLVATSMESLMLCVDQNAPPPYGNASQHPDGVLYPTNWGIRIASISDGLSHTVMVVETIDDTKSCWLAGADATLVGMPNAKSYQSYLDKAGNIFDAPLDYNGLFYGGATPALQAMRTYLSFDFRPGHADAGTYPAGVGRTPAYGPSSGHPGIVNHLFCDGSVKSIRKGIDYAAYFFLITRANGDTSVSASDY
jgi:prepilin-type N-terminal cleavage/methylation domain-containing protein